MNILENSDFELNVTFEAENDSQIAWYCNNLPLEPKEDCIINIERGKSVIKILYVDKKKIGKYEVVIQSKDKITKSSSSVKLRKSSEEDEIKPPVFVRLLKPKQIYEGQILLVEAEVNSTPCASFQWFVDTREMTSYAKENKLTNIYVTTRGNVSCLCIEDVTKIYEGVVTCRAENFAGSVACSASLQILEKERYHEPKGLAPFVNVPLQQTLVMDGEPVLLSCEIVGQPWPIIVWYHNKHPIKRARDVILARQESGLCELYVKEAFPEMEGKYKCVATNEFGSCSTQCAVTVEGSIPLPAFVIACNIACYIYRYAGRTSVTNFFSAKAATFPSFNMLFTIIINISILAMHL